MTKPNRLCLRAVDFTPTGDTERGAEDNDGRTMEGYAAVFDTPTEINSWEGKFSERIAPGAFRKTIRERKPVLQFDHGKDARTGSIPIGAFKEIREDGEGLFVSARLFDNPVVEPIRQAIEGGALSGMSFRFRVVRDEWRDNADKVVRGDELEDLLWDRDSDRGPLKRTIKEVELFEAGPVVFPAYPETSVGVRSISDEDRAALVEEYRNSLDDSTEETSTETSEEGAVREDTPSAEKTPDDAAPEGTSSGHEKETVTPVRAKEVRTETRKERVPMNEPMTIEERVARQDEIKARLTEIDTEFSGAELPEETRTEWDSLGDEFEAHERAIEAAQERAERLRAIAGDERSREHGSDRAPRRTSGRRSRPENIYDLNEIRQGARSPEDLGGLYRDNAMRAVEQGRFGGVSKEAAQERAAYLLDNVDTKDGALARRILATGSPVYERAFGKAVMAQSTNGLTSEERAALAVGAGATGGYAVPFALDPTVILTNDGRINPLRPVSRVESIVTKTWQGVTSAGITVSRSAEAAEVSSNEPALAQPEVTPQRVTGFIPFSMEIDQDWGQMRAEMSKLLADAKDQEEAESFFLGDGTGVNAGGVVATLPAGSQVEAAGASGVFTSADVYGLEEALAPRWRARGHFMANKAIYNAIRQFSDTNGHDLWERIGAGQPAELLGYPAHEASEMTDVHTSGEKFLLFGDFKQFLILDRVGMNVELVPHLFHTANNRPTGQRGILAVWRNTSEVLVPNAFRLLVGSDGV